MSRGEPDPDGPRAAACRDEQDEAATTPRARAARRVPRNWIKGALYALRGARPCPACGGRGWPAAASWMHAYLRCARCGLIYVADLPPAANLEAAYARVHQGGYQIEHKRDWRPWIRHKQATLDALGLRCPRTQGAGPRARALELGCGEGQLLKVLTDRGWTCEGLELNPVFARQAGALGPFAVTIGPAEEADFPAGAFDLVVMNHLIEHLRRPLALLERARGWLAPGGQLVLETPIRPDYDNIDHLYCFSAAALELALRRCGFEPRAWFDYVDDNYGHHNLACRASKERA